MESTVNVVDSVLGGKNYCKPLKGLQLLKRALSQLQWDVFYKDMLADLRGMVASSSNKSVAFSCNFEENSLCLFNDFNHFIDDARNSNETFKY